MKEIIYIQAGEYSNYTGAHFWNTQEAYLAQENADLDYDLNISFQENSNSKGHQRRHPRLLIFDHKANFGTLAETNASLGVAESSLSAEDSPAIWSQGITEYRQEPIPRYPSHPKPQLGSREDFRSTTDIPNFLVDVRFWSDFNRVSHIPRTIQKLPDPTNWENPEGDWNFGKSMFSQYDQDQALMDGDLRLFLEECDSPQGLQIINDASTFGGFVDSFLASFRDQYDKMPCLVVPILSDAVARHTMVEDYTGVRKAINDALYLRNLNEIALLNIPIQPASIWTKSAWNQHLTGDPNSLYHNSAVLSALIETATLSLRTKTIQNDLVTMADKLNWRGTTRFCELMGIFPFTSAEDFDARLTNFSANRVGHDGAKYTQYTRLDATRGFTPSGILTYEEWSASQSLQDAFVSSIHTTPYPIPTSHPRLLRNDLGFHPHNSNSKHCSVFSSLSTSSSTAHLFSSYASVIESYLKKKPGNDHLGFHGDELKDLVNDLWNLHDYFDDVRDDDQLNDSLGEDET